MPTNRGLGQRAARGALVTLSGQVVRLAVQFASLVLLSRLLNPSDYGLVAMAIAVAGLAEIFRDFGLSSAAIQAPTLSRQQRDNLFWANSALGLALMAVIGLVAPQIAAFFSEPDLVPIVRAMSVTFLLNGVATQYRAGLTRDMRFGRLAAVDVVSQVLGLIVGLGMAVGGASYWSLVGMQIAISVSGLVQAVWAGRWAPRPPARGVEMGGFFRFGWQLVGTQLLGYATNNVDSVVIGRQFGPSPLGLYDRAYRLIMLPLAQIRTPSTTVALPVLSRLKDDGKRYDRFVITGQLALGYTVVAALGVAAGTAESLVPTVLGDQWADAAPLFAILALAGSFQMLAFPGYWVYLSRGLTRALLQYSVASAVVKVGCILVGSHWGVIGVAWGVAVGPGLLWPVSLTWLARNTRLPKAQLLSGGVRVLLMAGCAGLTAHSVLLAVGGPGRLPTALFAGAATYLLGFVAVPPVRRDLREVIGVGKAAVRARPRDENPRGGEIRSE